jgi:hypothetical protein
LSPRPTALWGRKIGRRTERDIDRRRVRPHSRPGAGPLESAIEQCRCLEVIQARARRRKPGRIRLHPRRSGSVSSRRPAPTGPALQRDGRTPNRRRRGSARPRRRCAQSAPAAAGLVGDARAGHGAGGGGSCCQPPSAVGVQPQGTNAVCANPASVGVQHFGPFGSGPGAGSGSARATPPPDSRPAATAATIISFILMETIFFRIRVVRKSWDGFVGAVRYHWSQIAHRINHRGCAQMQCASRFRLSYGSRCQALHRSGLVRERRRR